MTRMLLQAPSSPIETRPLTVSPTTTPRRLVLRVMGAVPRYAVPAAALSVTHQVGEALVPVVMGIAIERAVTTGDLAPLLWWLGVLAGVFLTLSFSWRFGSRLAELGTLAVQHRLRQTIAEHVLRRSTRSGRPSDQPGVALSLAVSDAARLAEAVEIAIYPVGQLAAVLFGGTVLLTLAWPLGLAVLIGAPLLLWLTDRAGASLRERSGDEQQAAAAAAGRAADLMSGYRVIRGIGAEEEAARRYRRASRAALRDTLRARRAEGVFGGVMGSVTGLFLTGVAVVAALLTVTGGLGLGEFIAVVGLAQFLIDPLRSLALSTGAWWASATASAGRLLDVLRDDEERDTAPDRTRPAALPHDLLDISPGEFVVVAGDGRQAHHVLSGLVAAYPDALVAPHDAHLFSGTVRENVAGPRTDATRLASALRTAGCDELVDVLPAGWDTPVGENGTGLSGGQRQRVALARALARDAELLVLHDPTTAVDAVTEARIAERLRTSRRHVRTVVVTRAPAFLAVADRVVRLAEDGVA
ncbi:ABC transporter ATP-binding protein [Microbacterium sp.]|uniref:ABC transporter transmembrane domain-containing protein n=1 Tax=Microbacterium sp. TaxID=51671 RepID=UPI0025ED5D6E|nr:ABC transporter ATP-binding protein [Microbacterium sp.]MBT9605519.1 ABC transporter ATP-binding protein [Microbacterium sp.]